VLTDFSADKEFGKKIQDKCLTLGNRYELRVTSAHKVTDETLKILSEYEGDGIPTVFLAVAGRSNGLGIVLSSSSAWSEINCPHLSGEWSPYDLWSILRLPCDLGCSTVLSPEAVDLQAAQIFALSDHVIWSRLRASQLNTCIGLRREDAFIHKQ
jgi:phosphoribosylaminoimidazole carboxylase/phosphoribosylaminoimidazole-succinocarboxamide synthase